MEKIKEISKKQYQKLGFNYSEKEEIVESLMKLLANYQIHYFKLRKFHWNIEGPDFFELHEEFEKDYDTTKVTIDTIAERLRVFGVKPNRSLEETISSASIKDTNKELSAIAMVREILKDYESLHENMLDILDVALKNGDAATEHMTTRFMEELEKRNWMYTSWCK